MLRAMIVDDEELSIKRLKRLLSKNDLFTECDAFQHPLQAYEYAQANRIDVAFLDVSMPDLNGMTLSALLTELDEKIDVVFVTGFQEFAVQAFDRNALDYLMKPVHEDRLNKTLDRIRKVRRLPVSQAPELSVQLFNGFRILTGGAQHIPIKLRSPKTEELFSFLICKETVGKDEIVEALWPSLDYEKANHNLNTNLYYIRKTLGLDKASSWISATRHEISIDRSEIYCDVYEFKKIVKQIESHGCNDLSLIEKANSLYTGPLLQGRDYPWLGEWVYNLERAKTGLLEEAARFSVANNKLEDALRYFNQILARDVLREDVYVEIIRLYMRMGRIAEAIKYFHQLEKTLSAELGAVPHPSVRNLMKNLIGQ